MAYADPNDPRRLTTKLNHYYSNKEAYIQRAKDKKDSLRRFLQAVKSFPCLDCGVTYPYYVMQFDHRPDEGKSITPAQLVNCGSWKKTVDEIMKCDVVCSNCHAERTHSRLVR